jgi:hypothetical protein
MKNENLDGIFKACGTILAVMVGLMLVPVAGKALVSVVGSAKFSTYSTNRQVEINARKLKTQFTTYSGNRQAEILARKTLVAFGIYSGNTQAQLNAKLSNLRFGLYSASRQAEINSKVSTNGLIPYVGTVGIPAQSGKAGYHLGTDGSNTVWQLDSTFYTLAANRTTNGGINASALIPEFTWSLPVSSSYAFECYLMTTQLATNLPRLGFYAPRGPGVTLAVRYNYNSTSLTTDVVNGAILGVTSTGSTGYTTAAVVASAQTSGLWRIVGSVVTDASTSGLMGLVWGTSTTTSSTTLKTGSYCRLTKTQ